MGLDMSLSAEVYVGGWDHLPPEDKEKYQKVIDAVRVTPDSPYVTVKVPMVYWRKANAIHGWFVRECASGKDDCHPIYVGGDELQALVVACEEALAAYKAGDKEECKKILPPTEGFFFGGYEIDRYYATNLIDTIAKLKPLIILGADGVSVTTEHPMVYEASW